MDDAITPDPRPGGTVQPLRRTPAPREQAQAPAEPSGTRYELRDPFAEVTHRARTFDEMVQKADRAGAIRFQAIAADGKATLVHKIDGTWQRPDPPAVTRSPTSAKVKQIEGAEQTEPVEKAARAGKTGTARATEVIGTTASARAPETANASVITSKPPRTRPETQVARTDLQAERASQIARLDAALHERYTVKRTLLQVGDVMLGHNEYRFRGDTARLAFTESAFRLSTETNNPSVARSMVDVAETRGWKALRVSGNQDFKRMVWLEASVRGVKTVGYEPAPGDAELLRKEREARQINRIEPATARGDSPASATGTTNRSSVNGGTSSTGATTAKQSARGSGGRKTVLAALEAVLVARQVPDTQREAVLSAAADHLARRQAAGQTHRVKVFDKEAPTQRPTAVPAPEVQRTRERAASGR